MMKRNLDEILTHALVPTDEPPFALNQQLLNRIMEEGTMKKRRFSAAVLAAAAVLCLSSLTAYASWKYLSASQVAEKTQDQKLADYFAGKDAIQVNETQSYGGYRVTFLGVISGEALSDYPRNHNDSILTDRIYAVTAIENADGTPMPDTSDEAYGNLTFFVSPLIGGCNPALYNAASMNGNYSELNEDGILYRLTECDNVEIFADHELYLCISDTTFYNAALYHYDETDGTISRNEDYTGLNALFRLPLDASMADPSKAESYLKSLHMEDTGETKQPSSAVSDGALGSPEPSSATLRIMTGDAGGDMQLYGSDRQTELVNYAFDFIGTPYVYGGSSLTEGADSSGFVMSVYEHFGYTLPHSAAEDKNQGTAVESLADAQTGDLICFDGPSHVAIFAGGEKIIHVSTTKGVELVNISDADLGDISAIRRIITEE